MRTLAGKRKKKKELDKGQPSKAGRCQLHPSLLRVCVPCTVSFTTTISPTRGVVCSIFTSCVPCTVYRVPCTVYRVPCTLRLLLYLHGGSFAVASILAMTTDDTLLISVASCCERKIFTKKKDYICVHAHTHAHIHTQTHKHTHTHIHKHTHVHIHIYILYTHLVDNWRELPTHTHTHTHTHTDTHTLSLSHTMNAHLVT